MSNGSLFGAEAGLEPVTFRPDFDSWRAEARRLLGEDRPPDSLWWQADPGAAARSDGKPQAGAFARPVLHVPRAFFDRARLVSCHRRDDRWALLYRLLWRLGHGEPHVLSLVGDPEVLRVNRYAQSVHRDVHKMKAFVRFRATADDRYVAWFEPEHHIVLHTAGFFRRRFTGMRWSILTPDRCAHWEGEGEVWFSDGVARSDAPAGDRFEEAWRRYYRSIFNPARLKLDAMRGEMPQKYWKNLPEAREIPDLVRDAERRVAGMVDARKDEDRLQCGPRPASPDALLAREHSAQPVDSLGALKLAALGCRRCPLWEPATQTVFGEGPENARLMLVGEQPGDQEDLAGRPFVGPAGQVLDRALVAAGLDRRGIYLTNAVKHFRFKPMGKRRLHDRPREGDIWACSPWLDAEIERVNPELIVCLGATAAAARLGHQGPLEAVRGRVIERDGRRHLVTVHPSYLLRLRDASAAEAAWDRFVGELALAAEFLGED